MTLLETISLAHIAGALTAIALGLTFIVYYLRRLDPGTRDKLGGAQHRRWGVWCMGAGHGRHGQK